MKYAICNEMFLNWAHEDVARAVAALGYEGVEIAPFTLGPAPDRIPAEERQRIRSAFESAGLRIIGLHWLLKGADHLSITTPDDGRLRQTIEYLRALVSLCRDLGGELMVFGSPQQRTVGPDQDPADARRRAILVFREVAPAASESGITICFEPLTPGETNFINTMADGAALVDEVNHPAFRLHLDVKAMAGAESESPADVIRKEGFRRLHHFHANDPNLLGPGMGDFDFTPVAKALKEVGYNRWVSVETFLPGPGPEETARASLATMRSAFEAEQDAG